MGEARTYDFGKLQLIIVDDPFDVEIDGYAIMQQGKNRIILEREIVERLAIELMREYELEYWPEPEDDAP